MAYEGAKFYDNAGVFETYTRLREVPENANDTLERPVFLELLGDVGGLRFLDIGCGDAAFGKHLLASGAVAYLGVDGSKNMVAAAGKRGRTP